MNSNRTREKGDSEKDGWVVKNGKTEGKEKQTLEKIRASASDNPNSNAKRDGKESRSLQGRSLVISARHCVEKMKIKKKKGWKKEVSQSMKRKKGKGTLTEEPFPQAHSSVCLSDQVLSLKPLDMVCVSDVKGMSVVSDV